MSMLTLRFIGVLVVILLGVSTVSAQPKSYTRAKVSFDDFKMLVTQVEPHRAKRLIDFDTFLKMSKENGAMIFDTRSDFRFERIHIKGAKHLSFTDFTQANLGKIIPNFDTKILIYCNNNFEGNPVDFASKVAAPMGSPAKAPAGSPAFQFAAQAKPIMMALNIPTYVNLFGYGYRNVYELNELVNVNDPRIEFEGGVVGERRKFRDIK